MRALENRGILTSTDGGRGFASVLEHIRDHGPMGANVKRNSTLLHPTGHLSGFSDQPVEAVALLIEMSAIPAFPRRMTLRRMIRLPRSEVPTL